MRDGELINGVKTGGEREAKVAWRKTVTPLSAKHSRPNRFHLNVGNPSLLACKLIKSLVKLTV
jgi:hypothetical protein